MKMRPKKRTKASLSGTVFVYSNFDDDETEKPTKFRRSPEKKLSSFSQIVNYTSVINKVHIWIPSGDR